MLRIRILGVAVQIDASLLASLGFVAAGFGWFTHAIIPGTAITTAIFTGIGVAIAFSISLLVHELAHARTALNAGLEVDHVRLFAGGALCRRKQQIDDARHQFMVAAAGPIASVAVGIFALVAIVVAEQAGLSGALTVALWFIAFANALIAVSNMLPVFPFDGAKLVHSMFWRRTGDTRMASVRLDRSGREFSRIVFSIGLLIMAVVGDVLLGLVVMLFGVYLLRLPPPPP